ncbi:MAG TPA: MlaD family protein, partial [Methylomirabilota bacterium]|nr:MlaD family protein [Methylomirabilota bacterium]
MSKRANPTAVGAFVLAALALVVVGIVVLGGLQLFKKEWPFVMFFEGSLTGLDEGSPVVIRGVKIGTVSRIRLFATAPGQEPLIGVYVNIDPSLLPKGGEVQGEKRELAIADLIKQGLRAQLQTQSLLTGQLLVYLDFFPDFPAVFARRDPTVQEIPTIPTTLARLQARLEALLDTIGKVNLNELTV